MTAARGREDATVLQAYNALGFALGMSQKFGEAQDAYRRAVEIGRRIYPGGHRLVAESSHMLGVFMYSQGRAREALPHFVEALEGYEAVLGPEDVEVANVNTALGASYCDLGDFDRGLPHLERALAIIEHRTSMPDDRAATRTSLAQSLLRAGRDQDRAIALLRLAREHYIAGGETRARSLAEVDAMLARHAR